MADNNVTEQYPPTKSRLEQLIRKEEELARLREVDALRPFVEEMKENLFLALVMLPLSQWPERAKIALEHAGRKYPMLKEQYISRLPKS